MKRKKKKPSTDSHSNSYKIQWYLEVWKNIFAGSETWESRKFAEKYERML